MKKFSKTFLNTSSLFFFIAFIGLFGCQQQNSDPSRELKPVIDKYDEVWNHGNLSELDAIMDSDYVFHANKSPAVKGLVERKKMILAVRNAYPDLKLVIEDEFFSENAVAVRWHITGTNTGPGKTPPTGKSVDW
ncbi:MAG: ester cyclase [Ignavibacteriaceae bacterium]